MPLEGRLDSELQYPADVAALGLLVPPSLCSQEGLQLTEQPALGLWGPRGEAPGLRGQGSEREGSCLQSPPELPLLVERNVLQEEHK